MTTAGILVYGYKVCLDKFSVLENFECDVHSWKQSIDTTTESMLKVIRNYEPTGDLEHDYGLYVHLKYFDLGDYGTKINIKSINDLTIANDVQIRELLKHSDNLKIHLDVDINKSPEMFFDYYDIDRGFESF